MPRICELEYDRIILFDIDGIATVGREMPRSLVIKSGWWFD